MATLHPKATQLLKICIEHIDVPESYYQKAAARHDSLGKWLHRKESALVGYDPDVRPQGSFRYGTVIQPLDPKSGYDLDNVCLLRKLAKGALTQKQLKRLYGEEIKAYAKSNNMLSPVEEKNRCWRLPYADVVSFHLDTLPCVPEDPAIIARIIGAGVDPILANKAVAITDKRDANYEVISSLWPSSNPRGFATLFEQKAAMGYTRRFQERLVTASIEKVPPYGWKTTLQLSVQLLKRHRDVMFRDEPDLAPISMIITNLAAQAYGGETDLAAALNTILTSMGRFVRPSAPFVPNPADPAEDYADKWRHDSKLRLNFDSWLKAAQRDFAALAGYLSGGRLEYGIRSMFAIDLTSSEVRSLVPSAPCRPRNRQNGTGCLFLSASTMGKSVSSEFQEITKAWLLDELLTEQPGLRLMPIKDDGLVLRGILVMHAANTDGVVIDDEFEVEVQVPWAFPYRFARVRETTGRIPKSFHTLADGSMCLGSHVRQLLVLMESPTLVTFVNALVIPYLYGFRYWQQFGKMPFGELRHDDDGLLDDYADLFKVRTHAQVLGMFGLAALRKRSANKRPCACGSGKRLGRCHHLLVNTYRKKFGRRWFVEEKRIFEERMKKPKWNTQGDKQLSDLVRMLSQQPLRRAG